MIVELTGLDYVLMLLIVAGAIWGAFKGLIEEVSQKFGFVAGFVCALAFTQMLAPVFVNKLGFTQWLATALSYIAIFMLGYILVKILGEVLSIVTKEAHLGVADSILGCILGLAELILVIGAVDLLFSCQSLFDTASFTDASWMIVKIIRPCFSIVGKIAESL